MPCLYFAAMLLQPLPSPPPFHSLPSLKSLSHFSLCQVPAFPPLTPHNTPYLQSTSLVCVSCRIPMTISHLSPPPPAPTLLNLPPVTPPPHFLVLTSLSISALRVLCTSSPSRSISAFKRSFCSVSSCTFLSFSCSLSLRLFLAEEE